MDRRNYTRLPTRMHVRLTSGSLIAWGLLCNVSEDGLFIKGNQDFATEAVIDIEMFVPDNTSCVVTGIVRRRVELLESDMKCGLGVELIGTNTRYIHYLKSLITTHLEELANT